MRKGFFEKKNLRNALEAEVREGMEKLSCDCFFRGFFQKHHFRTSVAEHSFYVAVLCLRIATLLHLSLERKMLVRCALLHDIGLIGYRKVPRQDMGGHFLAFFHPANSVWRLESEGHFLSDKERNIIEAHMFPLSFILPKSREAWVLTLADKLVALKDPFRK